MKINLNDPVAFTIESLRALIASKDDSNHRQLRVTNEGLLYLSDDVGNTNLDGIKFAFETWLAGNDYCGPNAAADDSYVSNEYEMIKAAWEKGLTGIIDTDPRG
jgi:hypothetical protein